ncbi:MAG TPA: hypothetical protein P5121_23645 [Caldilineaceae bacterium]|nr:hypothetical protein [Caldilineaceae bacterium]
MHNGARCAADNALVDRPGHVILLMIGVAYIGYGWGTRFFAPSARLLRRWHDQPGTGSPAIAEPASVIPI